MACSQTITGITKDCATSMGGIKKVWIATEDPKATATAGQIASFGNASATFCGFAFKKNVCSMTSTLNVDPANGINYVSTELVLQFNRMETTKRIEIQALSLNEMYVIVLDSNGKYWYLGYDEPVSASAGTSQTGAAKGDGNFYQITLTDEATEWPFEIASGELPASIKTDMGITA